MKDVTSLQRLVERIDGQFMLRIPLAPRGDKFVDCTRGPCATPFERERRFYQTRTGPSKSATDKGALFIACVETILTKEVADFYSRHAKGDEQANDAGEWR